MSIDLHIHSSNSDGTDKIEDILNIAIEQQLQAISITDHEFLSEVENTNLIEIIPGVEMSVSWYDFCLLYTSRSPRDATLSRMPSSA